MPIKIVCLALPRGGISSFRDAMQSLGFKVMYQVDFLLGGLSWELADGLRSKDDDAIKGFLDKVAGQNYTVLADSPFSNLYPELVRYSPDIKFVLPLRDSPQSWAKSMQYYQKHVARYFWMRPFTWLTTIEPAKLLFLREGQVLSPIACPSSLFSRLPFIGHCVDDIATKIPWDIYYEQHVKRVQAIVPSERLLVWNMSDGWAPLEQFLDVSRPIRDGAFPHKGTRASIEKLEPSLAGLVVAFSVVVSMILVLFILCTIHWFASRRQRSGGNHRVNAKNKNQ